MENLTAISPVPPSLALEFSGGRPLARKVLLAQTRERAIALVAGGKPLAIAMLQAFAARPHRAELAIWLAPAALGHVRALVRFAQLTLQKLAQTGVMVFARMRTAAGERLGRMAGFRPGGLADRQIWIWRQRR